MKPCYFFKGIFLSFFCFVISMQAQEVTYHLDYTATYLVPKSHDTVQISVGDRGKFLYSKSKLVAKSLKSVTQRFQPKTQDENTEVGLMMNLETLFMLMQMNVGDNTVIGHVNLAPFMNRGKTIDSTKTQTLKATKTDRSFRMGLAEVPLYAVAPDHKPDDILYLGFDPGYPLDYNTFFPSILSAAAGEMMQLDIPSGMVVYAETKTGEVLLELIHIENNKRKASANLNLFAD
ncbi:MAG: hypothetical protein AAF554_15815 [Bacteroidota bacterium]